MGSGTSGTYRETRGLQSAQSRAEEMGSSLENIRPSASSMPNETASAPKTGTRQVVPSKATKTPEASDGLTTLDRNALALESRFAMNEFGHFGKKSKGARTIECEDPVADSIYFFEQLSKGGTKGPLVSGSEGIKTVLPEKDIVTHRLITGTPDSPAVGIKAAAAVIVRGQKVHFIKTGR